MSSAGHLERGRRGEQLAARFLQSRGYRIEQANIRFPVGEIDLVAWDNATLCFVEVRSASSLDWGGALASITDRKRRRLIRAAQWYVQRARPMSQALRFDVVAIQWQPDGRAAVELVQGAFDADGSWC